jgi:Holliday junction resolvasome RuvABC endonuclease subunit
MSLLGRLKNMLVEKLVEDEFYQPISEAEVYAVLNKKGVHSQMHPLLKLPRATSSQEIPDALALAVSVAQHTPEL